MPDWEDGEQERERIRRLNLRLISRRTPTSIAREDKARFKALAILLRAARKKANLKQATVARMMGQTQSWVSKLEHKTSGGRIDFVLLERLAIIYGCPLQDFATVDHRDLLGVDGQYALNYLGKPHSWWLEQAKLEFAMKSLKGYRVSKVFKR